MSIYVDVSAAVHRRAGWGRYAESLAHAMVSQIPERLALFYNRERGIHALAGLEHLPTRTVALGYKPWRMMVWLGQLGRVPFNRLVPGAELFHATEHLLMPLRGVPTVLTIHDLIFKVLPEHHKPLNRWYLQWTLPLYCRRADRVIAVSEATKRDLLRYYDLPEEKISVIPEAAAPGFKPQSEEMRARVQTTYGLPPEYLLMVGTIEPRKNLTRVLNAWTPLYEAGEVPPLVIVGKRGWLFDEFFEALASCPVRESVILPGFVADEDLPAVYSGATALVWASLYEGFGLPPLEAMASGAPVVCADTSSLPEVVGDAALMFEPLNEAALEAALRRIAADDQLREELRARGFKRAQRFSWERVARETMEVYDHVLASG
ncbi:MAG: glycosyltransferase family 4 protein [Anaerolineae bacterium]